MLSWIEFNCNTCFTGSETLFPSYSREIILPLSFWIVNAVNWYVPIIEKKSSTFFGTVWNIPSELDIELTIILSFPFGSVINTLTSCLPSSSVPTNTNPSSFV